MKTVKTPAGIFTINKVKIPSAYTCAAEQKIEYISEKPYADHYYGSGSVIWKSVIVPENLSKLHES